MPSTNTSLRTPAWSTPLAPRQPLEALAEVRAWELAKSRVKAASQSMALEAQSVEREDKQRQIE